eukprot:UC1_evm1s385
MTSATTTRVSAIANTSTSVANTTVPKVLRPPPWSSSTLGGMVFAHSGQAQPYNATQLALLARFPMVQFDKKANIAAMPNAPAEDRLIAAARTVRAAHARAGSPGVQILMYLNGLIAFPAFERLYNATARDNPSLLLRGGDGGEGGDSNDGGEKALLRQQPQQLCQLAGHAVFDMRKPEMRRVFLDAVAYGMQSGAFDGVFIDRANWAHSEKCGGGRGGR